MVFLASTFAKAQEDTLINKFAVKSFSVTPSNIFWSYPDGKSNSDFAGYAVIADVTFDYNKNLITFAPSVGFEFLGSSRYVQLNVMYGREFKFLKRLFLETHAGIGYLYLEGYKHDTFFQSKYEKKFQSTIGFPVMGKLRFMTGKRASVGLLFQTNINSEFLIFSTGISMQWNLWDVFE